MDRHGLSEIWHRLHPNDIQPWVMYFEMLRNFIEAGYLEVFPVTREAYITQPALYVISGAEEVVGIMEQKKNGQEDDAKRRFAQSVCPKLAKTAKRIMVYSQFLDTANDAYKLYCESAGKTDNETATDTNIVQVTEAARKLGKKYFDKTFALHVVDSREPHDLKYSFVIYHSRRWWCPWRKSCTVKIMQYTH